MDVEEDVSSFKDEVIPVGILVLAVSPHGTEFGFLSGQIIIILLVSWHHLVLFLLESKEMVRGVKVGRGLGLGLCIGH